MMVEMSAEVDSTLAGLECSQYFQFVREKHKKVIVENDLGATSRKRNQK